ncbi:hypothetical protein JKF63_00885 [Porcisia hertigi]|uniref:Conserved oligomeric Golgi complex subunit 2 n=1 Tax=Porcisia hertigi TaxID=2761500 RepID=A0A836L7E3_9TRYP|nr:hypothetical protein JKF63_00885 [Porcisia hertigi]
MREGSTGTASLGQQEVLNMADPSPPDASSTLPPASDVLESSTLPIPGAKTLTSAAPLSDIADDAEAEAELLRQELQLIQLCFAEHEFGILVEDDSSDDADGEGTNSSSCSAASSLSSSFESANGTDGGQRRRSPQRLHTFDPMAFVNGKVQHGVPLKSLSEDLHTYADYLEEKIAQCVNTDVHTAFVNVSGHLVGMRDELSFMERPLTLAMTTLCSVVGQLSATSETMKCNVEAACAAEMERAFDAVYLRCMVMYETLAYQLDDLAGLVHITVDSSTATGRSHAAGSGKGSSSAAMLRVSVDSREEDARSAVAIEKTSFSISPESCLSDAVLDALEDVVLLFQELKETYQRLGSLPSREQEKMEALSYVETAEQSVMGILKAVLLHTSQLVLRLASENGSASSTSSAFAVVGTALAPSAPPTAGSPVARQLLGRVIELYAQAGEMEQFSVVFRNAVIRPLLEAVISWKAATQARQSAESTVALLKEISGVLQKTVLPLLPLLRKHYGTTLHPVATVVWPILSETLVKKLPSLYEIGIPNQFQVKYKAAYELLAIVEDSCADLEELSVLRQSPDVVLWNHKWNLNVYAMLRVSEMDKAVQSVSSPLDSLPASTSSDYHCRIFYIAHQQLLRLFSSSVFLLQCTPWFLRQVVVFCYRLLTRVQEAADQVPLDTSGAMTAAETLDGTNASENGGTPARGARHTLLLAIADAHTLRDFLTGKLLHVILGRLEVESGQAMSEVFSTTLKITSAPAPERSTKDLVKDVLEFASVSVCGRFVERARETLVQQVAEAAIVPLQNLKSVRSAYSHTRKTLPSAASWYVAPVLHPLQRFAEEAQKSGLSGSALQECVAEMLRRIMVHFVALAKETLIMAKKTEESWEKLRRRKEGSVVSQTVEASPGNGEEALGGVVSTGGGQRVTVETASDRDKMTIQLWMDARALYEAAQVPPLHLPSETATELFASAFDLLRRAEWIQGADIAEPPDADA